MTSSGALRYKTKIHAICSYFDISQHAAKYIYHRRRRGEPFKNPESVGYIEWTVELQNALVKADELLDFKWRDLVFGDEEKLLSEHKIAIEEQSDAVYKKNEEMAHVDDSVDVDDDDWAVVINKPSETDIYVKHVIRQLHLLPATKID